MTAVHGQSPLIFLTTTDSCTPTGRNVRAQARASSARKSNPTSTVKGIFSSFTLDPGCRNGSSDEQTDRRKRRRTEHDGPARLQTRAATPVIGPSSPAVSIRILSTQFAYGRLPSVPNVDLEDVLKVAAFHIKRTAAQTLFSQPHRALEALRCRQWCSVSSTLASLGRTAYLDSAIACVVSKVQQVITGGEAEEGMLFSYADALHHLRAAVLNPALHDMHDMLAATQLLAVYEMLDFPNNCTWVQHVAGAAAMAKMQHAGSADHAPRSGQFVEALLNNEREFFDTSSWDTLLQAIMSESKLTSDPAREVCSCLTMLRLVFVDASAASQRGNEMDWSTRFALLSRAHEVRCRIKQIALRSESLFQQRRKNSKDVDILGMFLVIVMMLDKLILSLRPRMGRGGHDLQDDTKELCAQLIRLELDATESRPSKDLLRAFQRQMRYPVLIYGV